MPYINLEDEFPESHGNYKVKIQRENSGTETADAIFNDEGFHTLKTSLGPGDYIFEWFKD